MPPPPPPSGNGWGAPVPPQTQQHTQPQGGQGQGQYNQPQYQQGQYQQGPYDQQGYQQPYPQAQPPYPPQQYEQQQYPPPQQYEPPQQQYAPPPGPPYPQYQQQYDQQASQGPPGQYGPPPQQYGPPPGYQPPPQNYEQGYDQSYGPPPQQGYPPQPPPAYQQQATGDGSWSQPPQEPTGWDQPQQEPTGWDTPTPEAPDSHAYAPAYQDPLGEALPVATDSLGLQHEEQPGSGGFLRRIGRLAAEAAYIAGASGRMQRDVENIAVIRRPIGIGRMIGIIGPVPYSGTSIVTALLADTLASQRSDIVLAVDAYPREGKLSFRLDKGIANTPGSRVQLARAEPTADAISDVLAARNVGGANQIPLSLVDCPSGLYEEATAYVAGAAHAVALVIPSSREAALSSISELDQLSADGQQMLVQKGLVIITENQPDDPEPVRWLQSAVSDRGLGYVVLPYDAHLARAWPLQPERLEPGTRRAVLELTARLVERATR